MNFIAHIHTDFPTKFGIPRQSGLVEELQGLIIFEPEYRDPAAFKGLEGFSHIWLLWNFSQSERERWSATVKPPRLGESGWACLLPDPHIGPIISAFPVSDWKESIWTNIWDLCCRYQERI